MANTTLETQPDAIQSNSIVLKKTVLIGLVAFLLGETTINFIDRQVLAVLAPTIRAEFNLSNSDYASIINAFQMTYAVAYSFAGWVLDRVGVGVGLTLAVAWWSGAGMLTAFSTGLRSMQIFRSILAVGEAGAWPSFAKATATWVPPQSRSLVIGICNSGSSFGAMIAPILVTWITLRFGWRETFAITGGLGFIWVAGWLIFLKKNPELRAAEKESAAKHGRVGWASLLGYRQTWGIFFCRFFADPLWFFYISWIPEFLTRERRLDMIGVAKVAWIPFLVADVGNFAAGFVAMRLQKAGWTVNRTRKTMMMFGACCAPVGISAVFATTVFWTILPICFAIFTWMFWSVAVHTLAGDFYPSSAVGSAYGIAGTGSTMGAVVSTWLVGRTLDATHSYIPVFIGIGLLMPVAMLIGFTLLKRIEPVQMKVAA
jgi:ACS family hexuronate transporter-like MFS transporter